MEETIQDYLEKHEKWQEGILLLRDLMLASELEENIKWGMPTYTHEDKNIAGIGAFKTHLSIWFFQGGLLKDKHKKLVNAQEGKTKAMRHWRFTSNEEIIEEAEIIQTYIVEARVNQEAGRSIKPEKKKALSMPPELKAFLDTHKDVAEKFDLLTPARKRNCFEYVYEAKKAETKARRIQRIAQAVLAGRNIY